MESDTGGVQESAGGAGEGGEDGTADGVGTGELVHGKEVLFEG